VQDRNLATNARMSLRGLPGVTVTSAKPRAVSGVFRIDPVGSHATMAEIRHAVAPGLPMLRLRARDFASVTSHAHPDIRRTVCDAYAELESSG
jgi:hypothetical protein